MAINKINLDGVEYSVGGGGKAKLVATGEWDNSESWFVLNKKLEENKMYMLNILAGSPSLFMLQLFQDEISSSTSGSIIDNNDIYHYIVSVKIQNENNTVIYFYDDSDSHIHINDEMLEIEVYELPFTLGGNE